MPAHVQHVKPRRLWTFHGGLHLPDHKSDSTTVPIRRAATPPRLILPLQQHIGRPAEPVVKVGERVLKGQIVAEAGGYVCAPLHAPTSGTVSAIEQRPVAHPSGLSAPCIVIDTDGEDTWGELPEPWPDFHAHEPADLRTRIRDAGVVGLGGAAFPASVKLNPGPDRPIHTLILNGAECEPYITCDDMLMRERAPRVLQGTAILQHVLGATRVLIGIEDNKPEAIAALTAALQAYPIAGAELVVIPTKYPSGGEKQLIRILTGEEVPSHGIPAQIGIVCHNVGTAAAIADAVLDGRPLISRIVTLTGAGVRSPANLEVLIGTPAADLIAEVGGYTAQAARLILGGPMMGFALSSDDVPLAKGGNCLLAASADQAPDPGRARACIRCGECASVCPANLLPQQLYWHARAKELDQVQDFHLFDCIECGCCAHVCPAHIPLVQYYRFAKTAVWAQEAERRKAEQARLRHEARVARLERLEAERKARLRKKKEVLEGGGDARKAAKDKDPKKAAIEAALKRAAEKKARLAAEGVTPKNIDELTPAQRAQVAAADARRAAEKSGSNAEREG